MDFWHCHKPDHEEHDSDHGSNGSTSGMQKGYTANNKLLAKPGVGFVDLSHLLIARQNCSGIEVRFRCAVSDVDILLIFAWLYYHFYRKNEGQQEGGLSPSLASAHGSVTDTISQYQPLTS